MGILPVEQSLDCNVWKKQIKHQKKIMFWSKTSLFSLLQLALVVASSCHPLVSSVRHEASGPLSCSVCTEWKIRIKVYVYAAASSLQAKAVIPKTEHSHSDRLRPVWLKWFTGTATRTLTLGGCEDTASGYRRVMKREQTKRMARKSPAEIFSHPTLVSRMCYLQKGSC